MLGTGGGGAAAAGASAANARDAMPNILAAASSVPAYFAIVEVVVFIKASLKEFQRRITMHLYRFHRCGYE